MNTHRYLLFGIAAVTLTSYAWSDSSQEFIAASVKLSANQNDIAGVWGGPPIPTEPVSTLNLTHAKLQGLLSEAYSLRIFQISGPSWIESTYYDVTAKVPKGAGRLQMSEMLQKLLSERFQMQVRLETKESNGWALVVGRPPLKLKRTSLPGEPTVDHPDGVPGRWSSHEFGSGTRKDVNHGESMHGLALTLWAQVGEPVQDVTGLKGAYDFTLELEGVERMASPSPASVWRALRECGLDLVRRRVQAKRLIVESATKTPTPN
jgi:uncharacterized protein (TIGR03435 family)